MNGHSHSKTETNFDYRITNENETREFENVSYLMIQNTGDYPARIRNWTIYPGSSLWLGNEYSHVLDSYRLEIKFLDKPIQLESGCEPIKRLEFLTRTRTNGQCARCNPSAPGPKVPSCVKCRP